MLCAMPHRNDASENSSVAQTNSFVSPKRRVRKPVNGRAIALLTANEVITQVLWLELTLQVAGDGRQRDVRDRGVEHLHEGRADSPTVDSARFGGRNSCSWPPFTSGLLLLAFAGRGVLVDHASDVLCRHRRAACRRSARRIPARSAPASPAAGRSVVQRHCHLGRQAEAQRSTTRFSPRVAVADHACSASR